MKFTIAELLWTTTVAALLFATLRTGAGGFYVAFMLLNCLQVTLPVGILFATIAFADQREQMLDIATLPGWKILKKIWFLSIICTIVVWLLLLWLVWSKV